MKRFNRFVNIVSEIKIILGVGQGWFHEFRNAVLIGASLKVLLNLSIGAAVITTILLMAAFYLLGLITLPFYKRINELTASKYNAELALIRKIYKEIKRSKSK